MDAPKAKRIFKSVPLTALQQETILNMRAAGENIPAITKATGVKPYQVRGLIERSRRRGDARAALVTSNAAVEAKRRKIRALCEANTPLMEIVKQMAGELGQSRTLELARRYQRAMASAETVEIAPEMPEPPKFEMAKSLGIEPVSWSSKVRGWHDAMGREGEPAPIMLPRLRFLEGARQ